MMNKIKNGFGFWLLIVSVAFSFNLTAMAASNPESKPYIDYFKKASRANIKQIVDDLYWSGITDTRLYDMIQAELKAKYMNDSKVSLEVNSWLVKALAISGNKKYLKTMEQISESDAHKKLKKHTAKAIEMLHDYARWLPVMNKGISSVPVKQRDQARVKNMLKSSDGEMIRIGAKRVYHNYTSNTALLKQVERSLLANHSKSDERVHVDAMAWLIKTLAESMDSKYKSSLEKVAGEADNKKVRKYAEKYAAYL